MGREQREVERKEFEDALQRQAVAAETIRTAFGDSVEKEASRIITALASAKTELVELQTIQTDAKAFVKIMKTLNLELSHLKS